MKTPYTAAYDIEVPEGTGNWLAASRYNVWTKRMGPGDAPLSVLERRDGRVLRIPDQERVMHQIPIGTPYHIEHDFGFWRTTGADTLFLRAEYDGATFYTMIVGTHGRKFGSEAISWFCPRCGELVLTVAFDMKRYGLAAFAAFALDQVRDFNAAASARTCAKCGHVHPSAYGVDPRSDRPEEADARAQW